MEMELGLNLNNSDSKLWSATRREERMDTVVTDGNHAKLKPYFVKELR